MGGLSVDTLRAWALVAVSLFNTVLLLWLGLTLWLHADRRDPGVVVAGAASCSAAFSSSATRRCC